MDYNFIDYVSNINWVYSLFQSVNCVGNTNCIFFALRDNSGDMSAYMLGGAIGGAIGAFAAGVEQGMSSYPAFLINQTENGIGIIPLSSNGKLAALKNFQPLTQAFTFIGQNCIENVTIKKYTIFNKGVKRVQIKVPNSKPLKLMVSIKQKHIPYQEENVLRFMSMYGVTK